MVSVSPSAADPRADSLAVHTAKGVAFAPLVTEGCREVPRSDFIGTRKRQFIHPGTPCHTACFPHEREPLTGKWHLLRGTVYEEQLLVSTALLAAAVAAASCEKTPAPKPQFRPYLELAGTRLFSPRVRGKFCTIRGKLCTILRGSVYA
jgi:hypothetical protein